MSLFLPADGSATVKLEVYKEKLHDSKLGSEWFLPTLQKKEALESSKIEGTQALERDKIRYYNLLNNTREKEDWNEWIKFFLQTVARQCDKHIDIVSAINDLYENILIIEHV